MQVSVETLSGLERKLLVSVPSEEVQEEVDSRLKKIARTAKINGFRPGKAPMQEIVKRYSQSVRYEVAKDKVQTTLYEAITAKELNPAGYPNVDELNFDEGKDLTYTALFEVYPEIKLNNLDKESIEVICSEVTKADIDHMIEELRKQNQEWEPVKRAVANGDRVRIDFEGFIDNEPFEGGKAEDFELLMGSGSMIPGFEDGVIGAELDKPIDINVKFPKDYQHAPLADKDAVFKITVKSIDGGKLPEVNDAFAENFGITEGGVEALRKDIGENMSRMLERQVSAKNREKIFDKFLEKNPIELPKSLVENEIHELKHEMFHRVFGQQHNDNEKIPDFPRELFEEQAKRRVHLGLIFSEFVKIHEMVVDQARIDAMINKMSGAYEGADELRQHYQSNKQQMAQLEALVLEEMVADKLLEDMKVNEKKMTYDDVVNPKKNKELQGE